MPTHVLTREISGVQIHSDGIVIRLTSPNSDLFHWRNTSCHCCENDKNTIKYISVLLHLVYYSGLKINRDENLHCVYCSVALYDDVIIGLYVMLKSHCAESTAECKFLIFAPILVGKGTNHVNFSIELSSFSIIVR